MSQITKITDIPIVIIMMMKKIIVRLTFQTTNKFPFMKIWYSVVSTNSVENVKIKWYVALFMDNAIYKPVLYIGKVTSLL